MEEYKRWNTIVANIEKLYDVDQIWSKGFGDWIYEYKFRRGGKTLCTLYMKKNVAVILFTLGKKERDKYDEIRATFTDAMNNLYDETVSYHDGKWLWVPIDFEWSDMQELLQIKRRPNRKQETT